MLINNKSLIKTIKRVDLTNEQETKLNSIDNKVDKIDGKGLSTEDFTTEEKTTLANLKTIIGDNSSGLVKDVEDLKTNGVSQDNINSAVEKYLQDNPIGTEAYNPEDIFMVGNIDTDIATDGLVLWINSNVKNGKILPDLSGNGNDVSFDSTGFTFEENGGMSVNSDNGSTLAMITIPETNILTLEYTITTTSPAIGNTPVITTYNTREECGFKFGASQDYYVNYAAMINKVGDKTGDPKLMDSETMTTASFFAQISEYGTKTPHHLVVRYTPEIKKLEMFLDGSLYKYYVDFSETNGINTLVTKIGFFYIDVNNPYSGSDRKNTILYDAKAYSKSLSNEEILKNYNNLVKNGVI